MVDPLHCFSFQPVLHDLCNIGHDMYYPVCWMMHLNDPLLLLGKSSPCSGCSAFSFLLSEWFFTIRPVLLNGSASFSKTIPSFRSFSLMLSPGIPMPRNLY